MRQWAMRALGLALVVAATVVSTAPAEAATARSGFRDDIFARSTLPSGLAFIPGGTLLVSSLYGSVTAISSTGTTLDPPVLDLTEHVCLGGERGMFDVEVDPEFPDNRFIYVSYSRKREGLGCDTAPLPGVRVSRYRIADGGLVADPASEVVLLDEIPALGKIHQAGDLNFGPDGLLYVSTGDGGCDYASPNSCGLVNDASRDRHSPNGKILRITRDGDVPASNPYQGSGTARCNAGPAMPGTTCQEAIAFGLRNPFRFAFDPNASDVRFFINDVGANHWEEVNDGRVGADYGWNQREGRCVRGSFDNCPAPPAHLTDPTHTYPHDGAACTSITGGAFVPAAAWPPPFAGSYLFMDYTCGKIFRLSRTSSGGWSREEFVTGITSPITMTFGPVLGERPALFYTAFGGNEIHRVRYTGAANVPPNLSVQADRTNGGLPLDVTFDMSATKDPNGDAITYRIDPGDGSPAITTDQPAVTHRYVTKGHYEARIVATDPAGAASAEERIKIDAGYLPPVVTFTAPADDFTFSVGQSFTMRATAIDPDGGPDGGPVAMPGSAMTWVVDRHHASHSHPYVAPTKGSAVDVVGPAPEDVYAARNSFLRGNLTVRDADGLTTVVSRDVQPKKITLTLEANLGRVPMTVNGTTFTTTSVVTSWAGWRLTVTAPQNHWSLWKFREWHDRGTNRVRVTTPTKSTGLKAYYKLF